MVGGLYLLIHKQALELCLLPTGRKNHDPKLVKAPETKNPKIALGIFALQDGLEFKKMKSTEIFRNHNKLKYN